METFDTDPIDQLERDYRRARVALDQAADQLREADRRLRRAYIKREQQQRERLMAQLLVPAGHATNG